MEIENLHKEQLNVFVISDVITPVLVSEVLFEPFESVSSFSNAGMMGLSSGIICHLSHASPMSAITQFSQCPARSPVEKA